MKYMKGSEIRSSFLEYFKTRDHKIIESSPLVPENDPTLLFANAGMNQFKDIFLGKPTKGYKRATTCQKVVRAGGKHNDLDNIGKTARHLTFFEMLGNFSFGDYFKKEAISYAWDYITNILQLPKEKLFVTVYEKDDEAYNIWRDMIGLDESKIFRKGEKDNFWQMGDTGPCGPCSEIFIDRGKDKGCQRPECDENCDCDRNLEIWNLVFMQFDRDANGNMTNLPKPSIDTGMGLERLASVLQNTDSNYDTDLIKPIIEFIANLFKVQYGENHDVDVALKVIADHSRSTSFLISDGVLPSNEGRGYVLRRIMRRAMRYGAFLGASSAFFYKVCAFVSDFMKDDYKELTDKRSYIEKIVSVEEESFNKTLNSGLKMISETLEKMSPNSKIEGETIFKIYDTHGFPIDLLKDIAEEAGHTLDMEGFEQFMKKQQDMAKKAGLGIKSRSVSSEISSLALSHSTAFNGYDNFENDATVIALLSNNNRVKQAVAGEDIEIVTDLTPFYPEGGGQSGDTGTMSSDRAYIEIVDTYKKDDLIIHRGNIVSGVINEGDTLNLKINIDKRRNAEKNHTATHILNSALRKVLGDHVRQAGSSVTPDGFRFDFTHFGQLDHDEINAINNIMNNAIASALTVSKTVTSKQNALDMGALAFFGEKYGDSVRVVEIQDLSKELCGGCHVSNTSEINVAVITHTSSIASGVRRIEGLTGMHAINYLLERNNTISDLSATLKTNKEDIVTKVKDLQESIKEKEKLIKEYEEDESIKQAIEALKAIRPINGINLITIKFKNLAPDTLRKVADLIIDKSQEKAIVLLASVDNDKVSFLCRVGKEYLDRFSADTIIKEIAKITDGSGGGRRDSARAGGKNISKVDEALEALYSLI